MKKELLLVMLIVFIPFLTKAEWVSLNKKSTSVTPPKVTLVSDDNSSTVLKFEIFGFDKKSFVSGSKNYQSIDLLSESFMTDPGNPAVPYLAKVLAIPDQAGVSYEVLEMGEVQTFENIYLPPARESWLEGSPQTPYTENTQVYASSASFPAQYIEMDQPSVFRDFRISRVSVFPVQYNPAQKELQVVSSITIRVNYGPGEVINPKTASQKPIAPSYGQLYKDFIFNYQSVLDDKYDGKENGHELMLCIMPDEYYDSFLPYAQWKRESGIDIHITKFSDIGANSSDPDIIRDYIADAYLNWEVTPTYALLVGDAGVIPYYTSSGYVSENKYVEIEGGDHFPEIMLGRFTNESNYGMQVMINKFEKYEKEPYVANTDWFKSGICCSNDAYPSQIDVKRFAASRMTDYGGFTVDTMMSDPGCTYSNQDVVAAINEGRSFLNYRGEGWTTGWWATCTPMTNSQVSGLSNGEKFTFVTSIGCGVAMFASGESFGETWLELGTLSSPRGAACFVGPAGNTHTTYNNKLDKGIYVGMFQEGLSTSGQGLGRGRLYLYNVYGTDPQVAYHFRIYCVLGDPSMHIWKDVPLDVNVDYTDAIVFGTNLVEFTVDHTGSGLPVEDAIVCVTGDDLFVTGTTDAAGSVYLEITAEELQTLTVTVTGGTVYPFQGTLEVIPPVGPWIASDYNVLNDVSGGNGDGLMDYGESILLSLAVKNIGTANATNVDVTLSTSDPYITFTDDTHTYSSINAGQSVLANDAFAFTVANDIPDEHIVIVNVVASSGSDNWPSNFSLTGHAPVLSVGNLVILDPTGNNNGLLDPGENVTITIPVTNLGSSRTPDPMAYLATTSPYLTLNTSSFDMTLIDPGATSDASFSATVSPSAVVGETVDLDFDMIAGSFDTSKMFMPSIGLLIEDWETASFAKYPWVMGGSADWTLVTDSPYEGVYCARSGNITHSQTTDLEVTVSATGDGNITFYRKVSSEGNYDYLRFYIDGNLQEQWSGVVPWGQVSYPVAAGIHTYKWVYYKDNIVTSNEDCAWIDYIIFPYPIPPVTFIPSYQTAFEESGEMPEGWLNTSGDDFDWTIISGPTPSTQTGPSGDHTTGSGYYIYTEGTYNNPYFQADLISPVFDLSSLNDVELRFWYHMWDNGNNHMGTLHLDVLLNEVWIEDVMTPISGDQGDQWFEQVVDLSVYDGETIKFRFRGITGADYFSDICIDDFSIDGTEHNLQTELTAFLEGPFVSTEMSTNLNSGGLIPLSQPFNVDPWYYFGTENVASMPNADVVDWILVELRETPGDVTSATPGTVVATKAGFLLKDGTIVSIDGSSPLSFDYTVTQNLFAVLYHRNHIGIISSTPLSVVGEAYVYDFSSSVNQVYGGSNAHKQLGPGTYGMYSGDGLCDGEINNLDKNDVWQIENGTSGYLYGDLNMDGVVDDIDKTISWETNAGKCTFIIK